jgi:hypothetical protein
MKHYLLYSAFILLLLKSTTDATCQATEEFDNLTFLVPSGFIASKTSNNLLLTDASSASSDKYFTITVNKSILSLKKMEKSFPEAWHESLLNDGVDNPVAEPAFVKASTNSGWNCFRGGKTVQYNAQLPAFYYHLTIMRYLGITLRIVTRASSEELFMQKYPQLIQLVSSVNFKTRPAAQNNNQTVFSNQGNPGAQNNSVNQGYNQSVQLNTLYISVQGDLLSNGALSILYFLPDGNVFTDIPEKGFSNFNIQDQRAQFPELFGSFTSANNTISIKMNTQASASTYSIEPDGSLRAYNNTSQPFKKIEPLDYYQFEGTFIKKQDGATGDKTIVFYRDGRFSDNGLIKTILPNGNEVSEGSGNYTSKQNSLSLQYSDGRQLELCFYMMPEDFKKAGQPGKILLNNYILLRQ